jgi:hypothetical protein
MSMDLLIAKRVLGLFSIGLGVIAVASPERVSRFLGLEMEDEAMSAFGAREIASGAGLLSPVKPGPWFWMRVGGDVMDLAALGRALGRDNPRRHIAALVAGTVAAIAVIDVIMAVEAMVDKRENARAAA